MVYDGERSTETMPCTVQYETPEEIRHQRMEREKRIYDDAYKVIEERFSALLCGACTALERLNYDFSESPDLDTWWHNHKIKDEERKEKEFAERAEKAKAKLELEKAVLIAETKCIKDLTREERKLLKKHKLI